MSEEPVSKTVAGIDFGRDPTAIPLEMLFTWVIWQYPRRKGKGYFGAVRPSDPASGWYPAIIQSDQRRVLVYTEMDETFLTPEAAAKHLETVSG